MRRSGALLLALLSSGLLVAPAAQAHGLSGRQDLPIPDWLFTWGASLVLVVSFVALAVLWSTPRLQEEGWRPLPDRLSRIITGRAVEAACGAAALFLLGLVVYSGIRGIDNAGENFAPTFVYIVFWLGFLPASVLLGDVFRAFNPWRAAARAVRSVANRAAGEPLPAPLSYPERLGRWPAAVGILAFAWLELAATGGDRPQNVAIAALVYSGATWIAMALYGIEPWIARGEAFSVYFNLVSRLSVFERRGGRLGIRRPLSGLAAWDPLPGSVAFLATLIGTVSFDGFSSGPTWSNDLLPELRDALESLGFGQATALELSFGLGLIAAVLVAYGFYRLGVAGARSVGGGFSARELAGSFAHSLGPIALVYAAAHYVSFLLLQGQAIIPLASDPLGNGSDLLGTADTTIDYGLIGASTFWYLQVGFVLAGHVAALILAHDRAVAIYERPQLATRSQYWMLAVMVGFTTFALWLLSEASKG